MAYDGPDEVYTTMAEQHLQWMHTEGYDMYWLKKAKENPNRASPMLLLAIMEPCGEYAGGAYVGWLEDAGGKIKTHMEIFRAGVNGHRGAVISYTADSSDIVTLRSFMDSTGNEVHQKDIVESIKQDIVAASAANTPVLGVMSIDIDFFLATGLLDAQPDKRDSELVQLIERCSPQPVRAVGVIGKDKAERGPNSLH